MLFKKLIFDNYKTYYGHQEINLYIPAEYRTGEKKNIILIGGLNGAGKTTILKAILYILFGKRGMSESEYKKLFSNVINNKFFDEGGRDCSISLVLESDKGEDWELKVSWSFDNYKRVIQESRDIEVRKPGMRRGKFARIENIEAFNRLIDKMIPYHAAPFFIFDGEEIKDIILRQNSQEMKESIHKITGMETYKLLLTDLKAIQSNLQQSLARSVDIKKRDAIQTELNEVEEEIKKLESRIDKEESEKKKLEFLINEAKEKRNQKIYQNSKSRETIVKKLAKVTTEYENKQKLFSQLFKENAVGLLLVNKIKLLQDRLKLENSEQNKKMLLEASLTPYRSFMNQLLEKPISPPLSNEQLEQIKKIGEEIWLKENNIKNQNKDFVEYHDISNRDYQYLINLSVKGKDKLILLVNLMERQKREIEQYEAEIANAPEEVDISEENAKIDLLSKKIGEHELKIKASFQKLRKFKDLKGNLLNQITRLSVQSNDFTEIKQRLDQVNKIVAAFEQYVHETTVMKAEYIREEFSKMLKQLFRKQDEFGKIDFDINSYSIRLFNDRGQEISIQDRSAGEMQMISSALIWALTKASDLSLPMVIDTPLGRLDSYHRNHLIEYYYKELSEQVIILSTDTEITKDYVELMKNNSYKQYMLDYDQQKKYTVIRDGYFNFVKV
jgi:DNA sulfur modification protein DndD